MNKSERYREIRTRLQELWVTESDEITVMATVACELFHGLDRSGRVRAVLDLDSDTLDAFDEMDAAELQALTAK